MIIEIDNMEVIGNFEKEIKRVGKISYEPERSVLR